MKFYVIGQMRGIKYLNYPKFASMKKQILKKFPSVEVVTPPELNEKDFGITLNDLKTWNWDADHKWESFPMEMIKDNEKFKDYDQKMLMNYIIKRDIDTVIDADAVCVMDSTNVSKGAKAEYSVAVWSEKKLFFEAFFSNKLEFGDSHESKLRHINNREMVV